MTLALGLALCAALAVLPVGAQAATPGDISGKVTNAETGQPINFRQVCAYTALTHVLGDCSYTDLEGKYLLENLEAGSYKVEFQGSESSYEGAYITQWYNGKPSFDTANSVAVTEGNTTSGINAAMQERGGKISGTVTNALNGAGLDGMSVCAYRQDPGEYYFGSECTRTSGGGQYTLSHLSAGAYYVGFFSPFKYNEKTEESEPEGPNFVAQYFTGKVHREEGNPVNVTDGTTTAGINAALQPGAAITGTVTDAVTGSPLRGVDACAWGASLYYCDTTDAAGNYLITTVASGPYKVEFDPEKYYIAHNPGEPYREHWLRTDYGLMEYTRQYFNNKFAFAAAESVTATGGVVTPGINAKLTKETQPAVKPGTATVKGVKVKGGKVLLKFTCSAGTGPCKGNVKLTAQAKAKKKIKKVIIGKASFGILPGKSKTVAVKLNGQGKGLLRKAGKAGLKVKVTGKGVTTRTVFLKGGAKGHK